MGSNCKRHIGNPKANWENIQKGYEERVNRHRLGGKYERKVKQRGRRQTESRGMVKKTMRKAAWAGRCRQTQWTVVLLWWFHLSLWLTHNNFPLQRCWKRHKFIIIFIFSEIRVNVTFSHTYKHVRAHGHACCKKRVRSWTHTDAQLSHVPFFVKLVITGTACAGEIVRYHFYQISSELLQRFWLSNTCHLTPTGFADVQESQSGEAIRVSRVMADDFMVDLCKLK